jgi:nitroimidazol reductase NimA-like FMN-containing flavoprotein (pyridoxamine 5'-phosphate oxidase superfamily)
VKLTKKETEFVESVRVARVATVDAQGVPHNVPVCPVFLNGKIYFATEKKAKKLRNISANPNVTMVFDEYTEAWDYLRGVMIQGQARIVPTAEFSAKRKRIYEKYSQYESKAAIGARDSVIVEVQPDRKFSWGLE